MEPKISIIVPIFNVEKYLKRCVESLINQSYNNIEIILVNDASSDKSGEICDSFKNNYDNVVVLHRIKSGGSASAARNDGLKVASGKYISFVDSDDWIHPDMIKSMITVLLKNNAQVAECDLLETSDYNLSQLPNGKKEPIFIENSLKALKRVIKDHRTSVCIRVYDYELIKDLRFPEDRISEDVYFTIEVLQKMKKLVYLKKSYYYYFITPDSVTRKPYSLKYLDSLNSGLHLQEIIKNSFEDQELLIIVNHHVLKKLLYHYKKLNYNSRLDPKYTIRKKIKTLIDENYFPSIDHGCYLKFARYLSIKPFEILINMNKLRHKILERTQFS